MIIKTMKTRETVSYIRGYKHKHECTRIILLLCINVFEDIFCILNS